METKTTPNGQTIRMFRKDDGKYTLWLYEKDSLDKKVASLVGVDFETAQTVFEYEYWCYSRDGLIEVIPTHGLKWSRYTFTAVNLGKHEIADNGGYDAVFYKIRYSNGDCMEMWRDNLFYARAHKEQCGSWEACFTQLTGITI